MYIACHIYVALESSGNFVDNKNYCFVDNRRGFVADDLQYILVHVMHFAFCAEVCLT